jgi:hypothetical protein
MIWILGVFFVFSKVWVFGVILLLFFRVFVLGSFQKNSKFEFEMIFFSFFLGFQF